ncbi:MAG: TetR/AcrR family transcriptional regulator [Pseudomonadota bacterium]
MTTETVDQNDTRRETLLQAAIGVFLRYGYKKTSMDDLARAADLSRQGLYLHFATKEELFKEAVIHLTAQGRLAMRNTLKRDDLTIEERLLGAFVAFKSHTSGGDMPREHMDELLLTANQLVGPAFAELEQAVVGDLTQFLQSSGIAVKWRAAGLTARDIAQNLYAASYGIKHQVRTLAEYTDRMQVAVRLVCRASADARPSPSRGARKV